MAKFPCDFTYVNSTIKPNMVSTSVSMSYQKIKIDFQFQIPAKKKKKELKLLSKSGLQKMLSAAGNINRNFQYQNYF